MAAAERGKHGRSTEMAYRNFAVLGGPKTCQNVNPMVGVKPVPTRPLETLTPGERATVLRIPDQFEHEDGFLEYLDSQGVKPGVTVALLERGPRTLRVEVDGVARSLRPDCGQKVWMSR